MSGPRPDDAFGPDALHELGQLLRAAARTEIMPRFRHLEAGAIRDKGAGDLVTDADEAAETMIAAGLRRLFPGCVVMGEEATARDPALPNRLADAPLAFTVDPIDGTANFVMGIPLFGVMASAVVGGRVAGSVILDPVCDDMAVALSGGGAWLERPDGARHPLRAAPPLPPARMHGVASWRYLAEPLRSRVAGNLARLGGSWDFRCAAHQYRALAAGHCHFLMFNRLMPWDHLPGVLLHREAGGYSARFDGSEYRPGETGGGLICAPDREAWGALREALLG